MDINSLVIIFLQSFRNPFFDFVALFLSYLFSTTVIGVFTIFLIILFLIKKQEKLFILISSIFANFAILTILKEIIARPRPDYVISLPMLPYSQHSFPSGHTAMAFLFAVIFSRYYPKYTYAFYIIAALAGISRLYLGVHYLGDILVGMILGILIGKLAIYKENELYILGKKIIKFTHSFLRT